MNKSDLSLIIVLILLSAIGCNSHVINIKNIESSMNTLVGKNFVKSSIHKLILETDSYSEYEIELGNGCAWAFKVDKATNFIESWRVTSDIQPCEEGVISNG
jgi:hypothetical protein